MDLLERADAETVLIYACTANTFQEDREMAMESGMNDFLTKPINVDKRGPKHGISCSGPLLHRSLLPMFLQLDVLK